MWLLIHPLFLQGEHKAQIINNNAGLARGRKTPMRLGKGEKTKNSRRHLKKQNTDEYHLHKCRSCQTVVKYLHV